MTDYSAPEGTAVVAVLHRGRHVSSAPPSREQVRAEYTAQRFPVAYDWERSVPRHRAGARRILATGRIEVRR